MKISQGVSELWGSKIALSDWLSPWLIQQLVLSCKLWWYWHFLAEITFIDAERIFWAVTISTLQCPHPGLNSDSQQTRLLLSDISPTVCITCCSTCSQPACLCSSVNSYAQCSSLSYLSTLSHRKVVFASRPERRIMTYCAWGCFQRCDLWPWWRNEPKQKGTFMRQTGYLPKPPTSTYPPEILHVGSCPGSSGYIFQVSWKSVKESWSCGGSEIALSHWRGPWLIQQHVRGLINK